MDAEIVGEIAAVETIAAGAAIRELGRLRKSYGRGRWRKKKGHAWVKSRSGAQRWAEVHWYEAHGIGKRELKVKRYLSE